MAQERHLILVDSSAWIEYLRRSGRPANLALRAAITAGERVAVTDLVLMELLAGERSEQQAMDVHRMLAGFEYLPAESPWDYVTAAGIYRRCRRAGRTIRKTADCVIAAVAVRTGAHLLHQDRDFETIALHAPLRLYS